MEQARRRLDEARSSNRQLREERATLEAIINGTSDAIVVTDTADHILFFNQAACDAFLDGTSPQLESRLPELLRNEVLLGFWKRVCEIVPDERERQVFALMLCGVRDLSVCLRARDLLCASGAAAQGGETCER